MGFSLPGLLLSLAVLAPNLLLLVLRPRDPVRVRNAGLVFVILERAGQAGCLVLPALSGSAGALDPWLVAAAVCVAVYWGLWVRYAAGRRTRDLYRPLWRIPIPMAVFPVAAFVLGAVWLRSPWVGLAALVLAAGHLPNSWAAWRGLAVR